MSEQQTVKKQMWVVTVLWLAAGAGLGWLAWRYVGCRSGCAISGNPWILSAIGALLVWELYLRPRRMR